jgi:Na+:H+ antiporter, NhaA family
MLHTRQELGARRARLAAIVWPVRRFIQTEVASGVALLAATVLALLAANSPWADQYFRLLDLPVRVDIGGWALDATLHSAVVDGAMTLFFFVVGLEIKREATVGVLNSPGRLALPVAAAIGGMAVPALFYLALTPAEVRAGAGVPVATDIAFALGVLALLGSRVSPQLRVLLLTIAIVDDLLALGVMALFYSAELHATGLLVAAGALSAALLLQRAGVWQLPLYVALGVVAWFGALESGVSPSLAGAALGLATPWHAWYRMEGFTQLAGTALARLEPRATRTRDDAHDFEVDALLELRALARDAVSPLDRLARDLHPLVAFAIVPAFAFVSAGLPLDALSEAARSPVTWGIVVARVAGKPLGILLGAWVATRLGARLPDHVRWREVTGIGLLAGIGFAVALLITGLAFPGDAARTTEAKAGILGAAVLAGVLGYAWLRAVSAPLGRTAEGSSRHP